MKQYDYLVVGSGLFGAVFAHEAKIRGKKCLVIEKRSHAGGNVYCECISGITVHKYGPHIFHTSSQKTWEYVNRLCRFNNFINSPIANFHGELYNLPFNMNTFYQMWGVTKPSEARKIIEKQRSAVKGEITNLEQQAISLVGTDIYEKLIKGYTEKQWGKKCPELPASIIKRLPVRYTFDNNYFNDLWQGIPAGGYNVLISKLLEGVEIHFNTDYFTNRSTFDALAEKKVYTGRIDAYYNYIFGELEYRSLRFETESIDEGNFQGVAVVNYTDRETPYTRIIEHKHFAPGEQTKESEGITVITREYPMKLEPNCEPYYPVNDEKNQNIYKKYLCLASREENTIFGGRLAEYKYLDMDKTIESALNAAVLEFNE